MPPCDLSAFQYQVSVPSLDLKIERVCVDRIHSNCFKSLPTFRGVSLSTHRQSGTVNFAGWTSCRVTELFKVCFTDVDVAVSSVVTVLRFGRSRVDVWQMWDDQHWLRQICRNVAWVRLPGRSMDILQQSVVTPLLFWDSSHGSNNMCPSLVHDNALSCSHSNTHEHTSPPPRRQLVSSTLTVVDALTKARQINSSGLAVQTHVGCVTVVRLTLVEEKEKIGTMLDQPSQQRTSRLQRDSRLLFQEVFEGPRMSVHRLNSTLDLSVALALALGRCFRQSLAVSTILDSVTEGNNDGLLIRLEGDSLVPHEVQISHRSPCRIRVRHTLRRHWVTPDAFTLAISHDEH